MGGMGDIGGGKCCFVHFRVWDQYGEKRYSAFDLDAREDEPLTVTIRQRGQGKGRTETVKLGKGACLTIRWGKQRKGRR